MTREANLMISAFFIAEGAILHAKAFYGICLCISFLIQDRFRLPNNLSHTLSCGTESGRLLLFMHKIMLLIPSA